jgi:hypothetical protein
MAQPTRRLVYLHKKTIIRKRIRKILFAFKQNPRESWNARDRA